MYGFTAKSSVATLNICQILMRLNAKGALEFSAESNIEVTTIYMSTTFV